MFTDRPSDESPNDEKLRPDLIVEYLQRFPSALQQYLEYLVFDKKFEVCVVVSFHYFTSTIVSSSIISDHFFLNRVVFALVSKAMRIFFSFALPRSVSQPIDQSISQSINQSIN